MGKPVIENLLHKLASGKRRRDHLVYQIANPPEGGGNPSALHFIQAEKAFIDAAILALKYHYASMTPETSPVLALQELVDAIEEVGYNSYTPEMERLNKAVKKAHSILSILHESK